MPDQNLVALVELSKSALQAGEQLCFQANDLSNQASGSVVDVLALDAKVKWVTEGVLEQLRLAVGIAKTIEEKRARLSRQEWDNVRKRHSDALDNILEALGAQLVPPDFHEHLSASSLFGSQHSEGEEPAVVNVLESPRQSLSSTVRKIKSRPERRTWKTLRDFVDDQAIEDVLEKIENGRTHLDDILSQTDEYPEILQRTTSNITERLPDMSTLPAIDTLLSTKDNTITAMARHLESLAAHYDQMAGALNEAEDGEAFGEEDLQAMNRDTEELPSIISELEESLASIISTRDTLAGFSQSSKKSLAQLNGILDDLDELGDIMTEMLQDQDVAQANCEEGLHLLQQHVDTLEHLHEHYVAYQTAFNKLLLEIARRRQYREAAENIVRGMMSQLGAMTEEESQVRERFNSEHGGYLPEDLCLCIGNSPTRWEVLPWNGEEPETLPEIEADLVAQARERLNANAIVDSPNS
ncbi:Kinase activator [Mycena indigotica]|uniref:Autophagy-related protein 17 n=1 Tax=Mycena indigotica TaxID=2126181 RepID=A0A8H6T776_9AGAR|nr:Kinase activator [Mycena indigotica]KAF7312338.1 Kinase activator [Mycena indigotica]